MNKTNRKQLDVTRRGSLARVACSADAARAARRLLQDEVRARLDQERAMRALGLAWLNIAPRQSERSATKSTQSTLQSVARTLLEHPIGIGVGALAAGVAIARAMQSRA
jgi:hypothetical protein